MFEKEYEEDNPMNANLIQPYLKRRVYTYIL